MPTQRAPDKNVIHLIVRSGPDSGKMYFLKPKRDALIGRAIASDLRLTDGSASQKHCVVRSGGDVAFVQDLNSSNGTRINGERVVGEQMVDEDVVLEIGTSVVELSWVETESEVPLSAVESAGAPTLLEKTGDTARLQRYSGPGSTLGDAAGLVDFRNAQKAQGKMVGSFMLLEVIGVGGMGFVYRAKNFKSREDVALKLIPFDRFRTEELRKKFASEIRKGLQFDGAARILLVGEVDESLYVVSDFVKGRSLESLVETGRKFSPVEVVRFGKELSAVLQAAHEKGVVHGAITPSSVILTEDGKAALIDLGLGRRTDGEGKYVLTGDERLGLMSFRSPEQTREIPELNTSTDVYSLAATLYFLLTEHRPYSAETRLELARKIRWDDLAPVSKYRQDVSDSLVKTLTRALEKESDRRFKTAAEFGAALI